MARKIKVVSETLTLPPELEAVIELLGPVIDGSATLDDVLPIIQNSEWARGARERGA